MGGMPGTTAGRCPPGGGPAGARLLAHSRWSSGGLSGSAHRHRTTTPDKSRRSRRLPASPSRRPWPASSTHRRTMTMDAIGPRGRHRSSIHAAGSTASGSRGRAELTAPGPSRVPEHCRRTPRPDRTRRPAPAATAPTGRTAGLRAWRRAGVLRVHRPPPARRRPPGGAAGHEQHRQALPPGAVDQPVQHRPVERAARRLELRPAGLAVPQPHGTDRKVRHGAGGASCVRCAP